MILKILFLIFLSLICLLILLYVRGKKVMSGGLFCMVALGCALVIALAGVLMFRQNTTPPPRVTPNGETTVVRAPDNRKMDMLMWYDIDISRSTNTRPAAGWYALYPGYPEMTTLPGQYRSATPVMGLYDQKDPSTARQHLYWMSALGCNGVVCDWTNYSKYTEGADNGNKYFSGIYNCTEILLEQVVANEENFETPAITVSLRLYGGQYDALEKVLDEVYTLYEKYRENWYYFDDGSENADKPFVMIFADHDYLRDWAEKGKSDFEDDRFNIRWTNGSVTWEQDDEQNLVTPIDSFWSFWDCERRDDGSYATAYAKGKDGSAEQMSCWASIHLGGTDWDCMLEKVNGFTTFERSIAPVDKMQPKALLVCRFNYPMAWLEEPQEGVSLMGSTHIEPCNELGFQVFNNVWVNLYKLNDWKEDTLPLPKVESVAENAIFLDTANYPTEYRISTSENMLGEWIYYNINDGISLPDDTTEQVYYIQTRNAFGETGVTQYFFEINT